MHSNLGKYHWFNLYRYHILNTRGKIMKNLMKLPLHEPPIRSYLHNAYQSSIWDPKESFQPWFYMNYIHLVCEHYFLQYYLPDFSGNNWGIVTPFMDQKIINKDFIIQNKIDLISMIMKEIQTGWYVITYVNEKYIPETIAFKHKRNYNHMIMIYGYDSSDNSFLFSGFDHNWTLREGKVDFEQFELAYYDNKYDYANTEDRMQFLKLRINEDLQFDFDITVFMRHLVIFRDSMPPDFNVFTQLKSKKEAHYGLNTYNLMAKHIDELLCGDETIIIRNLVISLHLLAEHKGLMVERLRFIVNNKGIDLSSAIEDYTSLQRELTITRNKMLKFYITKNKNDIKMIPRKLAELKVKESLYITKILEFCDFQQ